MRGWLKNSQNPHPNLKQKKKGIGKEKIKNNPDIFIFFWSLKEVGAISKNLLIDLLDFKKITNRSTY